ncbi:MAG: hypothetical protein HY765_06310 [Rhodomicrobium sp.]|nr:hypothetical protein [Rhodomicrobium sp.]
MNIIPISFGLNGNAARGGGDARREQEALDAYSAIVTGVVESVAAAMVGVQRKAKPGAPQGGIPTRHCCGCMADASPR